VVDELAEWQSRPLDQVYPVVFIDALVRHEAPFVPSGGERTPPPGCRSNRVKLRAA
jgi:hypothetical protein